MKALAEMALAALASGDRAALESMSLSKQEFAQYVWPELPASRPVTNLTLDFVWNDVAIRSTSHMDRLLELYSGQHFILVDVIHRGNVVSYPSHRAFSDMKVIVRDSNGKQLELPLFGTLIEMQGVYKVYSFASYD